MIVMTSLEGKITMGHLLVAARRVTTGERSTIVKSLRKMLPNPLTDTESYFRETERAYGQLEWIKQRRVRIERSFRGGGRRKNRKKLEKKMDLAELERRMSNVLGQHTGIIIGERTHSIVRPADDQTI